MKEKNDIIHGPSLELLQFMEKDVDLMEEIQTDAKEIMKIQALLEPVVGVLLQVSLGRNRELETDGGIGELAGSHFPLKA